MPDRDRDDPIDDLYREDIEGSVDEDIDEFDDSDEEDEPDEEDDEDEPASGVDLRNDAGTSRSNRQDMDRTSDDAVSIDRPSER